MISVLTHSSERFCVGFKNGLHLINISGLQGLYIIDSLSLYVMVKVIHLVSCMLMLLGSCSIV